MEGLIDRMKDNMQRIETISNSLAEYRKIEMALISKGALKQVKDTKDIQRVGLTIDELEKDKESVVLSVKHQMEALAILYSIVHSQVFCKHNRDTCWKTSKSIYLEEFPIRMREI